MTQKSENEQFNIRKCKKIKKEDLERVARNNTFFPSPPRALSGNSLCSCQGGAECWREGGSKGTQRSFITEQSSGTWLVQVTGQGSLQVLLRLEKHMAT